MKNGSGRRAPAAAAEPTPDKVIRCAIYTRKSTEEGLQQDFSSLDAQREAGEAFIASQRTEGWQLVPERFDDGGFTGGNMDRPALKRLLAAIEAGRVNCVVVYKVDRLSRSLMDFARMMELFDRCGASFVSVTQQFNTINSLGRLTLNILLSFAQFERELISERTRDKMCAARRKGKWIGGHPVLGYDIDTKARRLVVNPDEAHQVRTIFDQYLELGAMLPVLQDLDRRGWQTKRWTTEAGQTRGGKPFTKSLLYGLLTNAIYTGQVNHKGTLFPGEHEAIIERATWERAQDMLDRNGRIERRWRQEQVRRPAARTAFLRAMRHRDGAHVLGQGFQALPLLRLLQRPAARLEELQDEVGGRPGHRERRAGSHPAAWL